MQELSSPRDGCVLSNRNETLSSHPVLQEDGLSWRPPQVEGARSPSLQPGPPPVSCVPCRPPFLFVFRTLSLALPTWRGSGEAEPSSLALLGAQLCNDCIIFSVSFTTPLLKLQRPPRFLKTRMFQPGQGGLNQSSLDGLPFPLPGLGVPRPLGGREPRQAGVGERGSLLNRCEARGGEAGPSGLLYSGSGWAVWAVSTSRLSPSVSSSLSSLLSRCI